jgi:hypothetical protein
VGFFKKRPEVIDLREPAPAPRRVKFEFGFPTRCTTCGERGYLDHIDPFKRIQYEHCPVCFARWEYTEDDIASLNSLPA